MRYANFQLRNSKCASLHCLKLNYAFHCLLKRKYSNEKTCYCKNRPHLTAYSQSRESQRRKDDLVGKKKSFLISVSGLNDWLEGKSTDLRKGTPHFRQRREELSCACIVYNKVKGGEQTPEYATR